MSNYKTPEDPVSAEEAALWYSNENYDKNYQSIISEKSFKAGAEWQAAQLQSAPKQSAGVSHNDAHHNLDVLHLGCCTKCGGTSFIQTKELPLNVQHWENKANEGQQLQSQQQEDKLKNFLDVLQKEYDNTTTKWAESINENQELKKQLQQLQSEQQPIDHGMKVWDEMKEKYPVENTLPEWDGKVHMDEQQWQQETPYEKKKWIEAWRRQQLKAAQSH